MTGEGTPIKLTLRVVLSTAGVFSAPYQKEEPMSTTHFPAVGHVYEANFGNWVFHLHFASDTVMTLTNPKGPFNGATETVQISVTPIRPGVYMICWQEADKTTVVHIHDYENGIVYTRVTEPNAVFIRRRGTLVQLR
jgi:hypothetical protein